MLFVTLEGNCRKIPQKPTAGNFKGMHFWIALYIASYLCVGRYKCCGGRGNSGYREWENHLPTAYPDSCCTVKYPDCGRQARK